MTPDSPAPVPPGGEPPDTIPYVPGEDREVTIWRAGFAAGRAAAHPDPPDMTNMCEGESPDHKPGITPAASPDERLREALTDCAATLMTVAPILEAHVYEPNASGYVWNAWTRWGERAASRIDAALTAADREAPDEEEVR